MEKNIFQTVKEKELISKPISSWMKSWQKFEDFGFKHYVYDDIEMEKFVKNSFPNLYVHYSNCQHIVEKTDLWRYLVVVKNGGVYADADTEFIGSYDLFIEDLKKYQALLFSGQTYLEKLENLLLETYARQNEVAQYIFACSSNHPALQNVIDTVASNIAKNKYSHLRYHKRILNRTGPGAFTDGIRQYQKNNQDAQVKIFPKNYRRKFIKHHLLGSWK